MRISETATRAQLIDPRLRAAGWNLEDRTQVDFEIPVDGYDKEPWNGISDYCLFHPSGEVLAVVEAKKTSRDPREGQEQLRIYLDKIAAREGQTFVPFGFMTNGQDIFYWDRRGKLYYAGLASDLRGRLKSHSRDRHKQLWDTFSVYLTIGDQHLRKLESLNRNQI